MSSAREIPPSSPSSTSSSPASPSPPFHDAFTCSALGLRDGLSPRLLLFSVGLWFGAATLWTIILVVAWSQVKAVAAFVTAWALLGLFRVFPTWLPASAQAKLTGVPLSTGADALLGPFFTGATWIVLTLLVLTAVMLTVRLAVEFWLMPLVRAQVLKHYPPFPAYPPFSLLSPFTNLAQMGLLAVVIGLPCMLIPIVNVVLAFAFFAYLNVRTLVNEALDGLATRDEQRAVIRHSRVRMAVVGILLSAAQMIPFVGLMSPAWIGAGTCHLCFRELRRLRA